MIHASEEIILANAGTVPGAISRSTITVPLAARGPRVYLHAALYVDERPGKVTLNHLISKLEAANTNVEFSGEFVLQPFAIPIGTTQ